MRFYRYLIYRLYSSQLRINDPTPGFRVTLMLIVIHLCPLMAIITILSQISKDVSEALELSKPAIVVFILTAIFTGYIAIYNKKRWKKYLEEFNSETQPERKKGTILIRIYIWTCLLSPFLTFFATAVFD
jgi:hypothetical protein